VSTYRSGAATPIAAAGSMCLINEGLVPGVAMAHGFSGVKEIGFAAYCRKICDAHLPSCSSTLAASESPAAPSPAVRSGKADRGLPQRFELSRPPWQHRRKPVHRVWHVILWCAAHDTPNERNGAFDLLRCQARIFGIENQTQLGDLQRLAGIAYMESIVSQYTKWDEWSPTAIPLFQGFRSDKGEAKILDQNMFVERVLFGAIFRELSEKEKAEYRKPFPKPEDRWPTLSWPRQLPIEGEPPHIVDMVSVYSKWMSENEIPKMFINGDPGPILHGARREFCRGRKNQDEVTVRHFLQEDSGAEIGRSIRSWLGKHKL
jgi:hypothetical protein